MSYVQRLLSLLTGSAPPIAFAALSEKPDPKLLPRLDQPKLDESALTHV